LFQEAIETSMATRTPQLRAGFRLILTASLFAGALLANAAAQAQSLIRDAEIERTLAKIARPLFKAAGVSPGRMEVLVVNDSSLNAFVVNDRTIFIHSGLIMRLKSMDMLQAVMAHELAHITSGHTVRRSINLQNTTSIIGLGLILAAAVAGASGNSDLAAGVIAGTAGSARGTYLAHTRAEESIADRIGARYMARAGIDPAAAVRVLDIFRGQEVLAAGRQDPYSRTHPLSSARIRALKGAVAAYGGRAGKPPPAELEYWYKRMRAKFRGFLGSPAYALRKTPKSDTSEPALLTRAIAYHRQGNLTKSRKLMHRLLAKRPNDPYYHELFGQILLEGRDAKAAVRSYKTAVSLAPKAALIRAGYGRALLSLKTKAGDKAALTVLRKAQKIDGRDARMLRDLAVAWAKSRNNGMASLVTAQRYALLGRFNDARTNALRAEGLLPRGSSGWLRAQDISAATKIALGQ